MRGDEKYLYVYKHNELVFMAEYEDDFAYIRVQYKNQSTALPIRTDQDVAQPMKRRQLEVDEIIAEKRRTQLI